MKPKKILIVAALGLLGFISHADSQSLQSGIAGIVKIALPGSSDTIISTPFPRATAASGKVLSFLGNQITFKSSQGWTNNQFVYQSDTQTNIYYLQITSGTKAGSWFTITANTASSLTVDLDGGDLTGLAADDGLEIIPYWTLNTLFPGGDGISASSSPGSRSTEIFLPDYNSPGINASLSRTFYFYNNDWLEVGQGLSSRKSEIIYPDSFLTVRQNTAVSTSLLTSGCVITHSLGTALQTSSTGKRDNYLGIQRPAAFSLAESGLVSSGAFAASPSPGNRTDELYIYDNAVAQKNKAPSTVYYYWNNAWRKVGSGATSFDTAKVFAPGVGFIIRKNPGASPANWSNTANY